MPMQVGRIQYPLVDARRESSTADLKKQLAKANARIADLTSLQDLVKELTQNLESTKTVLSQVSFCVSCRRARITNNNFPVDI